MMAELSLDNLLGSMVQAAKEQLGNDWANVASYAADQMKLISLTIIAISTLQKEGQLTEEQGKADLAIAKNTAEMALITDAGLTKLMAQKAIASALDAVKDLVDDVLDFPLL